MKIYFARHGEYQNPDGVNPYQLPGFPLTKNGKEQSLLIAHHLVNTKIRAIYTSPIERCVETATIISQTLHLFPNQRVELIETKTPLQGLTRAVLSKMSENYPYDIPAHIEGGGETPEDIFTRMNNFVNLLKATSQSSSYLLVSHGDPITIFLKGLLEHKIPHLKDDFKVGSIRYIPMGGLVMLDHSQKEIPQYSEII
ncbi:MAG: histidine phosphatase family protein [bacterium]